MTEETKKVLAKYLKGHAWLLLHQDSPKEEVEKVTKRLLEFEDQLVTSGVSKSSLDDGLKRAENFVATPVEKLSTEQQLVLSKLIYGEKTKDGGEVDKKRP